MIIFFSKFKFIFYLFNFFLILLYLYPGSLLGCFLYNDCKLQPQITADFIISTNGLLTFNISSQFINISLYLIFLSLALEVAHYFIPKRSFEFSDLFGNLLCVLIVLILFYFFKKNENSKT